MAPLIEFPVMSVVLIPIIQNEMYHGKVTRCIFEKVPTLYLLPAHF